MGWPEVLGGRAAGSVERGHVLDVLAAMPAASVHCVVTSPPYYGVRDYGLPPVAWGDGWTGQLGHEDEVGQYAAHLVEVGRALRRVLHPRGTWWLNLGDCYAGRARTAIGTCDRANGRGFRPRSPRPEPGCKPKDLILAPAVVALALRADGWYLRSQIVWDKRRPMPEAVQDRPIAGWESIFLLARSARYDYYRRANLSDNVWAIAPGGWRDGNTATFPPELARRAILSATADVGVCGACGRGAAERRDGAGPVLPCGHDEGGLVPAVVLDPFAGTGTTLAVARRLGRRAIGIELNARYAALAREAVAAAALPLLEYRAGSA